MKSNFINKTKISIFVFSIRAVHILIISHLIASTQRTLRKMPELHRTQDNQLKIKGPSFSFRLYVGLESMNIETVTAISLVHINVVKD